ncbi:ABC transporter permease [Mucilaginibacter terrae]|uniref:ABC transport system permease protein n=1 Tax=Mucilaginibacter terrae TaxID=1955052 RepID=A0ABU3GSL4_9SPHI|nr:ABC transporter permease [Mucilaginibacter terrae]MDT3402765.1 putative ABC transport system permease protein [Mucilaginibacter terrae]
MIKSYFKIALRNLWKSKFFSAINIIGLSIGIAACIVIMLFVSYEKSFDNFHTKNIYRLSEVQKFPGMVSSQKVALSMYPMGPTLKNDYPAIKNFTRVKWNNKYQLANQSKRIFLPQVLFTDSTFLNIFDFKLVKGDRRTALAKPNSVILTQQTAQKLFGDQDPMGKTIAHYGSDTVNFAVTGVMADVPQNSQLQFDGLMSLSSIYESWMNSWGGNWLNTYVELVPGTNVKALESKMPAYLKKHIKGDGWKQYELFYTPLRDVHAVTNDVGLDYLNYQKFDGQSTNLFSIIALVVLVIACVNFMNLTTARSTERSKEVGIRKSIGAHRNQLAAQFLGETVLLSFFSLLLAIGMVKLCLPYVNQLSQRNLELSLFSNPALLLALLVLSVVVGLVSGLYPAVFLSSFQPVKVLKGTVSSATGKSGLRNALVVGQFTSAVFLMIATVFVVKQLRFMQKRDPGFSREQIVTIPLNKVINKKYDAFKQQLLGNTLIAGVTGAQDVLGSHLDQTGVEYKPANGPLRQLASTQLIVDQDFLTLYDIKMALGKNFSADGTGYGKEYIINEALAKELLKDEPKTPYSKLIGRRFGFDSLGVITGIAKDFNFNSMHHKVETMFMANIKDWGYSQVSVKIAPHKTEQALAFIKSKWAAEFPDYPFEYQFVDDHFNEVYQADNQVSQVIGILAGLAIFISCLGLLGLASYSAEKRIKEIGVRKVMGASVNNIVFLLSGNFLKLIILANIIAWPLAWYTMHKWLNNFAYRVSIDWYVFALVALASIFIALFTISFQSIKAAVANPVKSLRIE